MKPCSHVFKFFRELHPFTFAGKRLLPHHAKLGLYMVHFLVVQLLVVVSGCNLTDQLFQLLLLVLRVNVVAHGVVIFILLDEIG